MKIGINLVGVSYNDGKSGRYRDYKDALDGFMVNVINPLIQEGHEISYYLFTYNSVERDNILKTYTPVKKSTFLDENFNKAGGGDKLPNNIKLISYSYIKSLEQLLDEDLDLIISTRYDISFNVNPFKEFNYDFNKCNYLWREPEFTHVPIVSDTFIVFPHKMTQNLINSIIEMETNPPHGVGIAMHNLYVPMVNQVGSDNVQWVCDEFHRSHTNPYFKLTRRA
jgi:hypothetical protein